MNKAMQYRKRPVVIDAIEWTGENLEHCILFLGDDYVGMTAERHINGQKIIRINTLEGEMRAPVGFMLIRGVKGEHYACEPIIFDLTYEQVT